MIPNRVPVENEFSVWARLNLGKVLPTFWCMTTWRSCWGLFHLSRWCGDTALGHEVKYMGFSHPWFKLRLTIKDIIDSITYKKILQIAFWNPKPLVNILCTRYILGRRCIVTFPKFNHFLYAFLWFLFPFPLCCCILFWEFSGDNSSCPIRFLKYLFVKDQHCKQIRIKL